MLLILGFFIIQLFKALTSLQCVDCRNMLITNYLLTYTVVTLWLAAWRMVSGVRRMNEVNARRARLVPGWVTVFGRVYHLCM